MTETVTVLVGDHSHSRVVPLCVNGRTIRLPVGQETPIPTAFLGALRDANVDFTIVGEVAAEAEPAAIPPETDGPADLKPQDNPDDPSGTPPGEGATPTGFDLSVLDGSIPKVLEALPGMSKEHVEALLDAERNGKTRATLIKAIEEAIAGA